MYRTGDLGYFAYDHRLYHLGRSDHQVKLRGYRIELQDIDANLLALDEIKRAVTELVQPPGGEPLLVAYLQSNDGNPLNTAALRRSLIAVLPSYMIPQRFVWIDEFPLTPNGKLDRQALREWEDSGAPDVNSYGPALSETEASLAEICQQLIGGRKLNRNDNFFAAGGHSLLALQAVAKIRERFGVSVPTRIITLEPLLEVARFIEDSSSKSATHSQVGLWSKIKGLVGLNK